MKTLSFLASTAEDQLNFIETLVNSLSDPEMWINIGSQLLWSVVLIIAALIAIKILNRIIENFFTYKGKSRLKGNEKRNQTLISVLQNTVSIFIWFVVIVMILETFNVPVTTLLAGAGVVGLAIGFGAQSLVKDMITGFFIILENQFDKGDFVRINTSGTTVSEGEVLSIGLRISRIQGYEGELFVIPNGIISEVINFSKYNSVSFLDINISIEEDADQVEEMLNEFSDRAMDIEEELVEPPTVMGMNGIANGEAIMRLMLVTQPMEHFGVTRRMRKEVKKHLAHRGVHISVPTMDIQDFDDSKKGDE